ncbi:MAG: peptidase, partial [Chitinophagaceae bacterium]|nr:peptidase [Rubrivivax sp.]
VTTAVPSVLRQGVAGATISGPAAGAAAGLIPVGEAAWGAALTTTAVTGELMPVADQVGGTGPGCEAFNPANTAAVVGRIALISRGVCPFTQKVKNAQNAGAIGVLIQDNVQEVGAPSALGGSDPTVTIPAVKIFLSDGNALREVLRRRSRSGSGVFVALGLFGTQYAGADALGRIKLYTPSPFIGGSSVSHYDTSAFRNQLMEPNATPGLTQSVQPPEDLTLPLFKDIGW